MCLPECRIIPAIAHQEDTVVDFNPAAAGTAPALPLAARAGMTLSTFDKDAAGAMGY